MYWFKSKLHALTVKEQVLKIHMMLSHATNAQAREESQEELN